MASYQINHYVDTPLGQLHIFMDDPGKAKKAEELINKTPQILFNAYKDGAYRYGKQIIKEAIKCINTQMPPKGESWKHLSESYLKKQGVSNTHFYQRGQYADAIDIYQDNMYYRSGALAKTRYFVGLPPGVSKWPLVYQRSKDITLLEVANILELGSMDDRIPARPLWKPLFENRGKDKIKRFVQEALKRELKKYM